jgi:hypothetical protein
MVSSRREVARVHRRKRGHPADHRGLSRNRENEEPLTRLDSLRVAGQPPNSEEESVCLQSSLFFPNGEACFAVGPDISEQADGI